MKRNDGTQPPTAGHPQSGIISDLGKLVERAQALMFGRTRALLGISGPPGVGKSTLAEFVVRQVGDQARLVGMDGFHLSRARLEALGRLNRMGALDTFDGAAFVQLVENLRNAGTETIYAPAFCRDIEESVVDATAIESHVRLVVVEGNYLLAEEPPWVRLRHLLDEIWYCERDEDARIADLIARHQTYGKSLDAARQWALGTDQRNAEMIAKTRSAADLIALLDGQLVTEPRRDGSEGVRPHGLGVSITGDRHADE